MNFLDFLNESAKPYRQQIEKEAAIEILNKNCKIALDSNNMIYRGMKGNAEYILADTTKTKRVSANTSNHYTVLFDHFLGLNGLPLRSESAICSTSKNSASEFGTVYVVLPYSDPTICSVGENDLWSVGIKTSSGSISYDQLNELYDSLMIEDHLEADEIIDEIKYAVDVINKGENKLLLDRYGKSTCDKIIDIFGSAENVDKVIKNIYDKDFFNKKLSSFDSKNHKDEELWFSGKALCIREDIYKEFLNIQ